MQIVNLDAYTTNPGDLSWKALEKFGTLTTYARTAPEEIVPRAKDAEILLVNKTVITKQILDQLPKLKYIGLQSTGYNVIDCQAAKEKGITVCNIPSYSTDGVAQLVFAFILEIADGVTLHDRAVKDGEWSSCPDFCFTKTQIFELRGKSIGIIGFGSIGRRVAEIAEAFGMQVLAYAPRPKEKGALQTLRFVELDELLRTADIITCHCPLTPETENLINAQNIAKMKKSAILINTSRGPVVDEQALADALNSGRIAAAGLDVLKKEPSDPKNPLLSAKNCYITPHIAWAAVETRRRLIDILVKNIECYLNGAPQNVVNP